MRLNDQLVTSFVFDGNEYEIDMAFDNILDVLDVFNEKSLRVHEMASICLPLLVGDEVVPTIDLWNHVYENFIHEDNSDQIEYDRQGNPMPIQKEAKKLYDFEKDAAYIYSSFRQVYDINLFREHGKLHWHEFKTLLSSLPADAIMSQIVMIRLWEPKKGDDPQYKSDMYDLQKVYALEDEVED